MDFTFKGISMISQMSHRYIFSDWNEKNVSSKEKKYAFNNISIDCNIHNSGLHESKAED